MMGPLLRPWICSAEVGGGGGGGGGGGWVGGGCGNVVMRMGINTTTNHSMIFL